MKNLARLVTVAAVLGATLVLAGCSTRTAQRSQVRAVEEFAIVESSTTTELTDAQIADLRQAVINYLQEQGLGNGRTYYVRVTFPGANPGDEPQWAVVRIGYQQARTYTVLAAYPGRDDYYPYDYYRMGYYGGYSGFSRWGYYDPFDYNYGYPSGGSHYYPRGDNKPDRPNHPDRPPGGKPYPPPGVPTNWEKPGKPKPDQPRDYNPPPRTKSEFWSRQRDHDRSRPEPVRDDSGGRSYTPRDHASGNTSDRSYSPPPERSYSPPPSPEPRVESSNSGIQQATSTEKER